MTEKLVDVIAVSFEGRSVLWVMPRKIERNAEACISMAIRRQGVEDRFFTTCEPDAFKGCSETRARTSESTKDERC